MQNIKVFHHFEAPKEYGVHFRLLCLTGENKGVAYFLTGQRIILGRSEKADIQIKDLKSSREHAELTIVNDDIIITDLGSQNGIIVNDLKIKQHKLKDGDKVIIGSTVYKFGKVVVEENKKKSNIEMLKKKLNSEKIKQQDLEENSDSNKSQVFENLKSKKIKPLHLVIGLLVLAVVFMDGGSDKSQKKRNENADSRYKLNEVSNQFEEALQNRRRTQDKELKAKLDIIFQRGLRESREGNYFRAMNEFNLALVLSPNDGQAQFYLQKTKDALDKKIIAYKVSSKKDEDSLKYQSAAVS